MDADFLSGLLLFAVVLVGAGYLIKTFFWESIVSVLRTERKPPPLPTGTSNHLVGAAGRVVDDGARSGKMRVRVGMETWHARVDASDAVLPLGTAVVIKAVTGRTLEVAPRLSDTEMTSEPATDHTRSPSVAPAPVSDDTNRSSTIERS